MDKEIDYFDSDFSDLLKHSEKVAKELWDNEEDEAWNDFQEMKNRKRDRFLKGIFLGDLWHLK